MTTLYTERLELVPLSEKYAPDIFKEFSEDITVHTNARPAETIGETMQFIRSSIADMAKGERISFVILEKQTGEFLGSVGASKLKTDTPWLGVWIKKASQGNGYGGEAVVAVKEWVDKHVQYAYVAYPVDKENAPSRKIAESLGGVIEKEYQQENMSGKILNLVEYRIYRR